MREAMSLVAAQAEAQGEVVGEEPVPMLHNCIIKRTSKGGKVKIENVPPEEFLIQRTAKSIETANFVAHRVLRTRSDLIEMGFDPEIVENLPTSNNIILNDERLTRLL